MCNRILLGFLLVVHSLFAKDFAAAKNADGEFVFENRVPKKSIRHWSYRQGVATVKKFYIIAKPVNGVIRIEEMCRASGLKLLEQVGSGEYGVYLVEKLAEANRLEGLKDFPEFFNIEDRYSGEKKDPYLMHLVQSRVSKRKKSVIGDLDTISVHIKFDAEASDQDVIRWGRVMGVADLQKSYAGGSRAVCRLDQIEKLASSDLVEYISKYIPRVPVNDRAREAIKIGVLQYGNPASGFLDTVAGLSANWNDGARYSGKGAWIGVVDGGVDSMHPDLGDGVKTRKFSPASGAAWFAGADLSLQHGTHVAGTILGNGALSEIFMPPMYRKYQLRGVAPKAEVHSYSYNDVDEPIDADVNNHSHTVSISGADVFTAAHDKVLSNHSNTVISVFAAGNQGVDPVYDPECCAGYFSLTMGGKNPIKVGASEVITNKKAEFSSLGPTYDGRIGIDVVAPGAGATFLTKVRVSSLDLIRNAASLKIWDFTDINQAWSKRRAARNVVKIATGISYESGANGIILSDVPSQRQTVIQATDKLRITLASLNLSGVSYPTNAVLSLSLKDASGITKQCKIPLGDIPTNGVEVSRSYSMSSWVGYTITSALLYTNNEFDPIHSSSVAFADPANINSSRTYTYLPMEGTSMAAPVVSGVIAVMLQKYQKVSGNNMHTLPFWNSTAKAVLIHTALDMISKTPRPEIENNPDFIESASGVDEVLTEYYAEGPDWATGFGLIQADAAISFIGTTRLKQGAVNASYSRAFQFNNSVARSKLRVTLAWDDPAGGTGIYPTANIALSNDLDLILVSPSGQVFRPWVLDYTSIKNPQGPTYATQDEYVTRERIIANPAFKGVDTRNNVEVADVENPEIGIWTAFVNPKSLKRDQSSGAGVNQDFSLVSDLGIGVASVVTVPSSLSGEIYPVQ